MPVGRAKLMGALVHWQHSAVCAGVSVKILAMGEGRGNVQFLPEIGKAAELLLLWGTVGAHSPRLSCDGFPPGSQCTASLKSSQQF